MTAVCRQYVGLESVPYLVCSFMDMHSCEVTEDQTFTVNLWDHGWNMTLQEPTKELYSITLKPGQWITTNYSGRARVDDLSLEERESRGIFSDVGIVMYDGVRGRSNTINHGPIPAWSVPKWIPWFILRKKLKAYVLENYSTCFCGELLTEDTIEERYDSIGCKKCKVHICGKEVLSNEKYRVNN